MRVFANLLDVVRGVGNGPAVNAGHWLTKRVRRSKPIAERTNWVKSKRDNLVEVVLDIPNSKIYGQSASRTMRQ
jgi:hypothetical protein